MVVYHWIYHIIQDIPNLCHGKSMQELPAVNGKDIEYFLGGGNQPTHSVLPRACFQDSLLPNTCIGSSWLQSCDKVKGLSHPLDLFPKQQAMLICKLP